MSTTVEQSPAVGRTRPERRILSRGVRRRLVIIGVQVSVLALLLLAWQFFSGPKGGSHTLVDQFYVSRPTAIWHALHGFASRGVLWSATVTTVEEAVLGFLLGALIGLVLGIVLGVNPFLAGVFQPFITALYAIPRLALVPLFMLWFGIGLNSKLALVISVVAFLVFYATYAGVKDVDHHLVDKMRLMRAKRWHVHAKVTVPSAMSFIIQGLGVSAPYALVVAVAAEMLASNRGLGYLLVNASTQFDTAGTFAIIFVLMLLGIVLMALINLLERRLLRWKPKRPVDRF